MTEPKPTYSAISYKPEGTNADLVAAVLSVRQYAIGLAVSSERLLEVLDHPVESPIVTRRERRHLTRRPRKRNI